MLVLVGDVHRGVLRALSITPRRCRGRAGVYVETDPGADPAAGGALGPVRAWACRWWCCARPTGRSRGRSSTTSTTSSGRATPNHLSRWCCPSSSRPAGGSSCSTTRPRCSSRAPALPEERHRHQRPLPPGEYAPSAPGVSCARAGASPETTARRHPASDGARRPRAAGQATALAIFASDALSSVAYATEEILLVLMLAGSVALSYSLPIAVGIAVLIAIVVSSYRQTILAYPQGGGAYIVTQGQPRPVSGPGRGRGAHDRLRAHRRGQRCGRHRGRSPRRSGRSTRYRVALCMLGVVAIAVANLRGMRESGQALRGSRPICSSRACSCW